MFKCSERKIFKQRVDTKLSLKLTSGLKISEKRFNHKKVPIKSSKKFCLRTRPTFNKPNNNSTTTLDFQYRLKSKRNNSQQSNRVKFQ